MTERQRLFSREENRRISETKVRSVPEPAFTSTWNPHSHGKVIDATKMALKKAGLAVGRKQYSLNSTGLEMFGLWEVGDEVNGKKHCVGFRNSMNKMISVGYTSVLTVLTCINQITHANWFAVRKHTSGLTIAELSELAVDAIVQVMQDFKVTNAWHEELKKFKLEKRRVEQLTVNAMREEVMAPSKFKYFDELMFGSKDKEPTYARTLYGFHGALTQLIRDTNFHVNADMNRKITGFMNRVKEGH